MLLVFLIIIVIVLILIVFLAVIILVVLVLVLVLLLLVILLAVVLPVAAFASLDQSAASCADAKRFSVLLTARYRQATCCPNWANCLTKFDKV